MDNRNSLLPTLDVQLSRLVERLRSEGHDFPAPGDEEVAFRALAAVRYFQWAWITSLFSTINERDVKIFLHLETLYQKDHSQALAFLRFLFTIDGFAGACEKPEPELMNTVFVHDDVLELMEGVRRPCTEANLQDLRREIGEFIRAWMNPIAFSKDGCEKVLEFVFSNKINGEESDSQRKMRAYAFLRINRGERIPFMLHPKAPRLDGEAAGLAFRSLFTGLLETMYVSCTNEGTQRDRAHLVRFGLQVIDAFTKRVKEYKNEKKNLLSPQDDPWSQWRQILARKETFIPSREEAAQALADAAVGRLLAYSQGCKTIDEVIAAFGKTVLKSEQKLSLDNLREMILVGYTVTYNRFTS